MIARSPGSRTGTPSARAASSRNSGVEPRLLGELLLRVEPALAGQHALHGQEGETVLSGRLAQLVEGEALALQRAQKLEPGLAVVGPVEQSLGFEVDRHAHMVPQEVPGGIR